jgi:hypothetical protein
MNMMLRTVFNSAKAERELLITECNPRNLYQLQARNALASLVQYPAHAKEFTKIDALAIDLLQGFPSFERSSAFLSRSRLEGVNSVYNFRNYLLDGFLPITLGIVGLLAMYQVLPLQSLKHVAPAL